MEQLLDFYYENPDGASFKEIYEFIRLLDLDDGSSVQADDTANYIYYGEQHLFFVDLFVSALSIS